ncbi:DIS3 mitotic control [Mayamaea pseudoterrestris]|nr:DIS3 mitotic control [Mayamaea pseudoterrestris]
MTVSASAPSPLNNRWVYRSFQRDAKLRPRERYWRKELFSVLQKSADAATAAGASLCIIPDGLVWRIYLPLLQSLITKFHDTMSVQWKLLESAAELMEHRNQAPCVENIRREYCRSQERSTLMRLVRQHSNVLQVYCDMSIRDAEHDEWEWLNFEQLVIEERSRHALMRAARMILEQSGNQRVWIVVSDDGLDDRMQLDDGVEMISISKLLQRLVDQGLLSVEDLRSLQEFKEINEKQYERMNAASESRLNNALVGQEVKFTPEQIQVGLQAKQLFRGRLNVTKENPREAFVAGDSIQYYIDKQRGHFQKAFHGDMVIIQPLSEDEWGRPVGKHRIVQLRDDDDENDALADSDLTIPPVPSARVVAIHEPSRRIFIATMVNVPRDNESHVLVVPMDVRIPKIRVHSKFWRSYHGKRLKIQVEGWDDGSTYPSGRCVEVLGAIGDLETELTALLLENQVELDPFSVAALSCLPAEGKNWKIGDDEISKRRDLRRCRQIFSVDPPGCQDIDDTMHAIELPNGDVEFGVHIADVAYFVAHESALDKEAQARGTTFYLVDRRFDMLPAILSSNLCSLHGNVDRLAVSVIWVMSPDFLEIKSTWYGRTVIRNCAAMTYDQADRIIHDQSPDCTDSPLPPPLTAGAPVNHHLVKDLKLALFLLTRLARKLRSDRETIGGAVDLSSGDVGNELKFTLVDGQPVKVVPKADKEIHHTIAEMMILANTSVATKIYEHFPNSALLRVHQSVQEKRFEELKDILEASKIAFDGKSNSEVAKSLKEARYRLHSNPVVSSLLLSLATRAMSEAQYVSAGDRRRDSNDFSHYGLGLTYYTHFTSPIRRYADVVVHKQLLATLEKESLSDFDFAKHLPIQRQSLPSLPQSSFISVLAGEGLEKGIDEDEGFLDALIEGAAELALAPKHFEVPTELHSTSSPATVVAPYNSEVVKSICEKLNLHNRLAKHSSYECQRLFLSLYFRNNVETADAVVVNLRQNGLWVYVPRFDLKAPVYLMDSAGQLQIDPALLGLPLDAGFEATLGFTAAETNRRFPNGQCKIVIDGGDERLVVSVPGGSIYTMKPLDVVHVQVTCDKWDASARVPNPRLQLLAGPSVRSVFLNSQSVKISSQSLKPQTTQQSARATSVSCDDATIFSIISKVEINPLPKDISRRTPDVRIKSLDRNVSLPGRFVYSSFVNPDSRSSQQESSQQTVAVESAARRATAMAQASRRNEFDSVKQYEREAMARQQRLASDKRSARVAKSRKGK